MRVRRVSVMRGRGLFKLDGNIGETMFCCRRGLLINFRNARKVGYWTPACVYTLSITVTSLFHRSRQCVLVLVFTILSTRGSCVKIEKELLNSFIKLRGCL